MANVTITKRNSYVNGSTRLIVATLTVADTNTWDTKLKLIKGISTSEVASNQTVAISGISGGVITFSVANGPVTGATYMVVGY